MAPAGLPERVEVVCLAFGDRYKDLYLVRLFRMLTRHMPVPFTLTVVTDRPRKLPSGVKSFDASGWTMRREGMRVTTKKLKLFDPESGLPGEFLYLDTTLVIQKDMTPLLEYAFSRSEELVVVSDWNYDCYNTCVMRLRPGGELRAVYEAFVAGEAYEYRVNGDQDFVHAAVSHRGLQSQVALFPEDHVVSYRNARDLSRNDLEAARITLDRGIVVKFFGYLKMHHVASALWRWKRGRKHPDERPILGFWVRELRERWR